jgi:hypothetical protein
MAIVTLICILGLSTTIQNVSAVLPTFLKGSKLDILYMYVYGISSTTQSASAPFYVAHGWYYPDWKALDPVEKSAFLQDSKTGFELTIDGNPVKVRKWLHYNASTGIMSKAFYKQFNPDDFAAGDNVVFTGRWFQTTGPMPVDITWTVTVTFT